MRTIYSENIYVNEKNVILDPPHCLVYSVCGMGAFTFLQFKDNILMFVYLQVEGRSDWKGSVCLIIFFNKVSW